MKVKKVNRYYCDFCKKSGCNKCAMEKHERHCTMNPNRRCRMCDAQAESPESMDVLLSILPDPKKYNLDPDDFTEGNRLRDDVVAALPALRDKTLNCPACILAAIRQRGIPIYMVDGFDFKAECEAFFDRIHRESVGYAVGYVE